MTIITVKMSSIYWMLMLILTNTATLGHTKSQNVNCTHVLNVIVDLLCYDVEVSVGKDTVTFENTEDKRPGSRILPVSPQSEKNAIIPPRKKRNADLYSECCKTPCTLEQLLHFC